MEKPGDAAPVKVGISKANKLPNLLSFRDRVLHPYTCIYVRLLGPCFKTGE